MGAKKISNPNTYLAVIAAQTKVQTELLKKIDTRQDTISESLVGHDTRMQEQNKSMGETLKQYFRLILALISVLGTLVGLKIYMS
jgi:hypothetical protein